MKVIGITGGIGSGKSTVSKILSELGAIVLDADEIAKNIIVKNHPVMEEIREFFGPEIIHENGELNKKKLGKIVFTDIEKLKVLNSITHKYIVEKIKKEIDKLRKTGVKIVVLDAPLPIKDGFLNVVDEVWVVAAKRNIRIKRIVKRNNITSEEALTKIEAQKTDKEYLKIADRVINNNGNLEELKTNVTHAYISLQKRIEGI